MRGRPRKYFTPEEALAAARAQQRAWRIAHRIAKPPRIVKPPDPLRGYRRKYLTEWPRPKLSAEERLRRNREKCRERVRRYRAKNRPVDGCSLSRAERAFERKRFRLNQYWDLVRIGIENRPTRNTRRDFKRRAKNPEKFRLHRQVLGARHRAFKQSGERSTLQVADIQRLLDLQQGYCAWCGEKFLNGRFDIDHIIPHSRGGTHGSSNFQLLCAPCNGRKAALLPWEFALLEGRSL